jgi:hypothetical protein
MPEIGEIHFRPILVKPMYAVSIYRALLLVRVGWLFLEWFFGWDARRHVNSFTLLHPYAALSAHAAAEFTLLVILIGLWFFRRWARLIFVFALAVSVVDSAFWPYHGLPLPPLFIPVIGWCVVILNGAIVAMSFLPPVRDVFATQT